MNQKAVELRITGRVQGVWYRAWTRETAAAKGLKGWVRNCPDGAVAALLAGPAGAVDAMIALCRDGPPHARVDHIDIRELAAPPPELTGFAVLR